MILAKREKIVWLVLIVFIAFGTSGCTDKTPSSDTHSSAHAIKVAGDAVDFLFVKSDWDHLNTARIKNTTTQAQIDYAANLVSKIQPGEKLDANTAFGFGFALAIENAQKQLDERGNVGEESSKVLKYTPNKNDVILKNHVLKNVDRLENFMKIAGKSDGDKIRVVKYVEGQGVLIYDLKSRYDKNAKQGLIEVNPDLKYYSKLKSERQDVFNNAPQQCGGLSKDMDKGYYKLTECRTNWEYYLLPIINDNQRQ